MQSLFAHRFERFNGVQIKLFYTPYLAKRSQAAQGYKGRGFAHKEKIFSLVERGGNVRSFHVPTVSGATLKPILMSRVATDANLMTDEAKFM